MAEASQTRDLRAARRDRFDFAQRGHFAAQNTLAQDDNQTARLPENPEQRRPNMPTLIAKPTRIQSAGNKPKLIDEYIGRVNSQTTSASVGHMRSPAGWIEPGQTPAFDEFTVVLNGTLCVEHKSGNLEVTAGQAVIAYAGEWVRYSTPREGGAEYIAVCVPAFSMDTVHRDPA
jgi:ethanolamine utilization protein EutQ